MDAAAGAFDDALAGHQPQAGTVGLGGEERVEQVRQRVRIHADAFVGHPDVHPVHAIALAGMAGNQAQAAAIGHGLDRVQRQVQHDLLQLVPAVRRRVRCCATAAPPHRTGRRSRCVRLACASRARTTASTRPSHGRAGRTRR
ncbi:hypothetical protein G6F35_017415 [Rhizopus arrhizus]|nr:hypothetical protein G6F35_017415 [Rhizopus arrhizus]